MREGPHNRVLFGFRVLSRSLRRRILSACMAATSFLDCRKISLAAGSSTFTRILLSKFRLVQSSRNWQRIFLSSRMDRMSIWMAVELATTMTFTIMLVLMSLVVVHPATTWTMSYGSRLSLSLGQIRYWVLCSVWALLLSHRCLS